MHPLLFDRRRFLQFAAAGLGVSSFASRVSAIAGAPDGLILMAYASRCGSTREIAQAVAQDLRARGLVVDLRPADQVASLAPYRAVALGSAVRFGKWLPESVAFVERHQAALNRLPKAFFTVHMLNTGADPASRQARAGYVQPIYARVKPDCDAFFAGKMDMSRLSFTERLLCKMMKGHDADARDWTAIHAWAQRLFAA